MATLNEKLDDIYFIILLARKKKKNQDKLIFSKSNIIPTNIYTNEIKGEDGTFFYEKVFKFTKEDHEQSSNNPINYCIEFNMGNDKYKALFEIKENSFVYDVKLKKRRKILKNITEEIIDQNYKDSFSKLNIFLEALKQNNEEALIDKLYKESIEMYSEKKSFTFFVKLFVHLYKEKELCPLLIEKFKQINIQIKENEKDMERTKDLEQYIKNFNNISSEADELIKNNFYDPIQFYGILLCFLNYYNYDNFVNIFNKLFKENSKDLFEILLIYAPNLLNPIKQDSNFYTEFISYATLKEFSIMEKGLNYIRDIETFIIVINETKEKIFQKYHKKIFKPLTLKAKLPLIKREKNREIDIIIPAMESIINFSKENKVLLVYFHSNFWAHILKNYNELNDINISICFRLREIFVKYNDLINGLFKNNKKSEIKDDINKYCQRDEFSFLLDKNIKKFLEINKELSNVDILGFIEAFNPYYKEDNYSYKRESYIFNYLNINDNNNQFIQTFRKFEFEKMFKDNIIEFLIKMISKIQNIFNFGTILELLDITKISKVNDYLSLLKKKYEDIIKKDKKSLSINHLKEEAKIIANFFDLIYKYEGNFKFIEKKIKELNTMTASLTYYELLKKCKDNKHKKMKEFIYQKLEVDIIINLIDNLKGKEKSKFFYEIMNRCKFSKEDFFENNQNKKIELLYDLNETGKLKISAEENFFGDIEPLLSEILDDIDNKLSIEKLEIFLSDKKIVIKKLGLMKIILRYFNPENYYKDLNKIIENIKADIEDLTYIKNLLQIFHKEKFRKEMKEILETLKDMKEKSINNYKTQKMQETIQKLKELKIIADQVKKYKDFLFFKVLYSEALGIDQEKRFNEAINKLDKFKDLLDQNSTVNQIYQKFGEVINKIKDMLSHNESKTDEFINQMIDYFELKDKKELIKEFTLLIKSKKFERDLKGIIYFFENFQKKDNNDDWIKKLSFKNINLSELNLEDLKKKLKELNENGIYDYEGNNNYCKLFTSLYEKKESIDFLLLLKTNKDINILYERIDPTNPSITMENIKNIEECMKVFDKLIEIKDNFKILNYIKQLNDQQIRKFEIYSKDYSSIIELYRNESSSLNLFEQVNNIIEDAIFTIRQENETFTYGKNVVITLQQLIHLKNKIHIKAPKEGENIKDQFQIKCDKLLIFKNTISNLEIIHDYMNILRTKGSNLPILIKIKIQYPNIKYFINKKETEFDVIREFLLKAKTDYIEQLDSVYKHYQHSRFLFGKSFRNIMNHLDKGYDILDILRFILNKTDNKQEIKDGNISNILRAEDYVHQYKIYNETSFENIFNYLTSLFKNNCTSLQKHYEDMLISEKNKYKGVYLHICENETMEEFILNIFITKIHQLPIAQNVLICSNETSQEEMQAFFYRAILCDYNTLFAIQINNSFSGHQQNIMYNYIDKLLAYKNEKFKEMENKKNIDKTKTKEYLKSCIIFIYNQGNKDDISFLNEIGNFDKQDKLTNKNEIIKANLSNSINESNWILNETLKNLDQDKFNFSNNSLNFSFDKDIFLKELIQNTKVITSDFCGLGKSYKIKKMIKGDKKKYYHFPLGGILSKALIFKKLSILLKKIKKENGNNYQIVAIHLDLIESKDISVINEFLFSFIITKFYTNNESIIYIPKDIDIYIEIPNCFGNFLSNFGIFNCKIFTIENIGINNILKLDLSENIITIFNRLLELDSNNKIEIFIKKQIGINTVSYHQIQIFIKLFIAQFKTFEKKKVVYSGENDLTENIIKEFAEFTKFFTMGGFVKMIMNNNDELGNNKGKKNYIDILTEIYINNDLNEIKFKIPIINEINDKIVYDELIAEENSLKEYKSSKYYLHKIKKIFHLPNDVEEEEGNNKSLISIINYEKDNYVITKDNFKKMILLAYRIKANIPVIIMGETGCGKTALIIKLNQILNNGELTVKIININPWVSDNDICIKMKEIDEEAKKSEKEIWIIFDEINTCLSLSLINEILINRTYNGEKMSENIRLIGVCNPYRKKKPDTEKYGLIQENNNDNELVYFVQPFPQTLFYYIFSFGLISEEDEKNYIYSIIEKLFSKDEKNLHEITGDAIFECHKLLREYFEPSVVSLREVSRFLKIVEFLKKYYTIKNEYENEFNKKKINVNVQLKNQENKEKLYKIKSIISSIYLCYYIRLTDDKRTIFNYRLRNILLKLVNVGESNNEKIDEKKEIDVRGNLLDEINYEELKYDLKEQNLNHFSDLLKIEEDFILDKIELNKDIGKNNLLKEIIFLTFLSVLTKIPLIIVGKPGTGKTLGSQLLYNSMRGIYSKDKFFKKFPQIIQTYFQGSESTQPEDIEKLFEIAENKLQFYIKNKTKKEEIPLSMVLLDELGLAEKSKSYPLKKLHTLLEYENKYKDINFIGISSYSLDISKENRCLILLVQNLEDRVDQLIDTSKSIVKSISEDLSNNIIFEILARAYYEYKKILILIKELTVLKQFDSINKESNNPIDLTNKQFAEIKNLKQFMKILNNHKKIKLDFHGNRDLFNYIKGIAREIKKLKNSVDKVIVPIIEMYIERNFGGIDYEIDIDLDLKISDLEPKIKLISEIFKEFKLKRNIPTNKKKVQINEKSGKVIVTSVFLFKKLYNLSCGLENSYTISNNNINRYDLNRCIIGNINDNINDDNINSINNRYLLLEIKPSLSTLIYQNFIIQNPDKKTDFYEGSPFLDDNNDEYRYKKVNEIQEDAKNDKLIILQNLNQIHPFLYDLYNMNHIIKDEKKYSMVCLDNYNGQLMMVNNSFRIAILVDKKYIDEFDEEFLNRLEKMEITFDQLLDNEQTSLARKIIDEINFSYYLKESQSFINYEIDNLLINCGKEEIYGLIYYFSMEMKKNKNKIDENDIKERIYYKIINMLPQDIITLLPDTHIIKKYYYEEKKYYNLKEYINDEENKKYKISIIYTFNNIANIFYGVNNEMRFMVSEIKTENQLLTEIDEIKKKNENNSEKNYNIVIQFEQLNSNKIQFISNFIMKYMKESKENEKEEKEKESNIIMSPEDPDNDSYNYIFLIHIKRNFNSINKDIIDTIPDINPGINQLFIDNLNGINIKLKDLLDKNIKDILNNDGELIDIDREFKKTLTNFIYKGLSEKRNFLNNLISEDNYIDEIQKFMDEEIDFKEKIIEKAKILIENERQAEGSCKSLLDTIYKTNYIGRNSIDIISSLLDYIKEKILSEYLEYIFEVLEDNNILTTLLEIKNNKDKSLDDNITDQLKNHYINEIIMNKGIIYEPKFLFNYKIPGFYNFYKKLSNFINKNITVEYFNNETNLREYRGKKSENQILKLHEKELDLLYLIYDEIQKDKFIVELLIQIPTDLILKDYITYYLDKYNGNNYRSNINNKLIELLLKLRFNVHKNQIIKNNKNDPIKILLIKIMWIESNVNYILSILKVFFYAKGFFNDEYDLYNMIEKIIYDKTINIKYITNENKNPEYTKEVNECFYIILASLCLCITSEKIQLSESFEEEDKVEIKPYCEQLKKINIIVQNLNKDLKLYLNEIYIIDELIEIIGLQSLKKINIEKIEEIRNYLRESALVLQKNQSDKINELKEIFIQIYNLIIIKEINTIKDKNYLNKYYDTLKYIYYKEIAKISDSSYHYKILEKLIQEKEIIKKSSDIFQILLKDYVEKEQFKSNPNKILKGNDPIVKLIEENLIDSQEDNYFALSETLLYFFEKNSFIYLENAFNNGKLLEKEPLDVFKNCLRFLRDFLESSKKLQKEKKYITKLFCLGYIKVFCFSFIQMFDDIDPKMINPEKIIEAINDQDLKKMIKLYNYKILFNQNQLDSLLNPKNKEKYKLEKYKGFSDFIEFSEEKKIDYNFETLDKENYEIIYNIIEKYKKDRFKNKITKSEVDYENLCIDNFYIASFNLILSNLIKNDFQKSKIYTNFYKNICEPLYEKNKLSTIIQFFFNPEKYEEIKRENGINSDNIESLLFGYRFCLNELADDMNSIYSTLYGRDNLNYLEKYYPGSDSNEKGLPIIDKIYFKKADKNIRNLSQISSIILNYILYSHLFFARIFTQNDKLDKYLPKGMNWVETVNECWILLKKELKNKGIDSIDIFMNYIFKDLFYKLHTKDCIENYDELIEFEKELDKFIQEKIQLVQNQCEKYKNIMNDDNEEKNSSIILLKEKYDSQDYPKSDYPFYEYFYYSDYLNEEYLSNKLSPESEKKYPLLTKYLKYKKINKYKNDYYSLDNLDLFNSVLNLFKEKYSHKISKKYAEKRLLKDDEIYKNDKNKKLIDNFIEYYNKLKIEDNNGNIIEITNKNHLCDFFIDNNNEIGRTYIDIYKKFIKKQNKEIEKLLNKKKIEIFNNNFIDIINVQQIKRDEICTFNALDKFSFINIVFNSSYRKIIDDNDYKIYTKYEINFELIEETMTELLLKNRKLLNEDIFEFSYSIEIFSNEVNDLITSFIINYNIVEIVSGGTIDKKVLDILDKFFKKNEINKIKCKYLINDFMTLFQYLNDLKKDNRDYDVTEDSCISEVLGLIKDNISKDFVLMFSDIKNKEDKFTIAKIVEIFKYFLQSIHKYVKEEINNYQKELEDETEELDDIIDDKKNKLEEYFNAKTLITKKDLASAIQLFMALVLFREKDKNSKIKLNIHNVIDYIKAPDFWYNKIYSDENFPKCLYELRIINIHINQTIWLYNYLVDYKEDKEDKDKERKKKKKKNRDDKKNLEIY